MSRSNKLIKHTWSCSTSQGISKMCGLCKACFVRILSLYAIKEGENIEQYYEINPFTVEANTLKIDKMTTFRILISCLEFWKNVIQPDIIKIETERTTIDKLISNHPVIKYTALDMYVGLDNYLNEHANSKILGDIGKEYLAVIDSKVLQKRQKELHVQMKRFGWCN